jgi:hypothetical protein
MADGVHGNDEIARLLAGVDLDDWGRRVRQFAIDAHRILGRPDSPVDEVFGLHRRAWLLVREASVEPSSGLCRWLLEARRAIDVRLHRWAVEEMESLVA